MFRVFISNLQCKHIVFGGCHDNGYLPNLDPYKHDPNAASRISLLETYSMSPGFLSLGFPTMQFSQVFRSTPLPDKPTIPLPIHPTRAIQAAVQAGTASPILQKNIPLGAELTPTTSNGSATQRKPSGPTQPLPSPNGSKAGTSTPPPTANTWATVGKGGITDKKINIASKPTRPRKAILLNPEGYRIDGPLARADKDAIENLTHRVEKKKVCNTYHLFGTCDISHCPYDHGKRLDTMGQLALRNVCRKRACPQRENCRDIDCIWGHVCPYNERCTYAGDCYFTYMHDIDTVSLTHEVSWRQDSDKYCQTVATKIYEDGSEEHVA